MTIDLSPLKTGRIAVIGDIMLDRYWHGDTARISPEAPVPVVRLKDTEERPGGAANVALNTAHLGAKTLLVGLVGNDEQSQILEQSLAKSGVECDLIKLDGQHTITKLRVMSRAQQLIRLDTENGFTLDSNLPLLNAAKAAADQSDVVILSDYDKGTLRPILSELLDHCEQTNKPVLVDPKGGDFSIYRKATLLTPNMSEFETVAGKTSSEEDLTEKAQSLIDYLELDALLITRSEKGMSLFGKDKPFHLPAQVREVFDVTGAGDTVIATLAAGIACGMKQTDAVRLANLAAGIVVGKRGTAFVSIEELQKAQQAQQSSHPLGVTTEPSLLKAVKIAKVHGETIVMTNGCFDILHAGHVYYLEQAKKLGDRLIVAVNDDDSVKRLKGPSRPVNTLANRMQVLAGLRSVDWVVPFSEDTPARLIEAVLPDKLIKGGDYKPQDIAGYQAVVGNGGEVLVTEVVEGCSTSTIIKSIKDQNGS